MKLKFLYSKSNLEEPLSVERFIFSLKSSKYKSTLLCAYQHYCLANGIEWVMPHIRQESRPITVPTEERIDKIISRCTLKYLTVFQLSKHGLRPDEVAKITLRDIDLETGRLLVRSSKLGAERRIKLKSATHENLRAYVQRNGFSKLDAKLFSKASVLRDQWNSYRRRAYLNFRDTELLKIRLYDLRHWYATTEYLKTRDLMHVKYLLGHRDIKSTLIYIHIAQGLAGCSEDFACKTAKSLNEATALIEAGFDYVTEMDGVKLFRKRK